MRLRDGLAHSAIEAARALAQEQNVEAALELANQTRQRYPEDAEAYALVAQLKRQQAADAAAVMRRQKLESVLSAAAQRPLDVATFQTALTDAAILLKANVRDVDAQTARQRLLDALRESAEGAADTAALDQVEGLFQRYRKAFADDAVPVAATFQSARSRLAEESRVRLAATAGDLVLLALPWGEVDSVTDVQRKSNVELPNDRVTPLRLRVPAGCIASPSSIPPVHAAVRRRR
ncbi:MAG: hypothetical protein IPG63_00505 [Xanthomonadales bacterium]|nr:hypothetical protein [Xanthomonadales bacterium]